MLASALAVALCLGGGTARAAEASSAADVAAGRALALRLCTACHVVSPQQELAPILRPPAPGFSSIANRPNMTEAGVRRFLSETHSRLDRLGGMPNPDLTDDQIREAAAFVMSLRTRR